MSSAGKKDKSRGKKDHRRGGNGGGPKFVQSAEEIDTRSARLKALGKGAEEGSSSEDEGDFDDLPEAPVSAAGEVIFPRFSSPGVPPFGVNVGGARPGAATRGPY